MSAHTPGPWKVTHDMPTATAVIQSLDSASGYPSIAVMMRELADSEADARLIAASPVCLKALEAFVAARTSPELSAAVRLAETAIAEAREVAP